MADNVEADPGTGGATFAADDISSVYYPRTKITIGADGVNDGDVSSANPLPIGGTVTANLGAVDNAVLDDIAASVDAIETAVEGTLTVGLPTGAATAANQATEITHLATLAGAVGGSEVQVDIVSSALPSGAATSAKQDTGNTSLASIDTSAGRIAGKYVDFDTGAGTDSVVAIGIMLPGSGGAVIGGTASNPIRTDPTGTTTQPVSAASLPLPSNAAAETGGNLAAAATSLNVMDDWDENDRAKVNIIAGQAGITAGAGSVAANTPRVTHASDDPAVALLTTIDADTSGLFGCVGGSELQVDIVGALPAGTNAIGKLAANSGVDIGDVDVTSIAAGDNNIGNVDIVTVPADPFGANADAASATGSISAKLRFIASTGIPITGTVTVGSHAVTNAGTFAVQSQAATSGGTSQYSSLSTAAVTAAEIKGSAGQVYAVHVYNVGAAAVYLRLYNQTGSPANTDTANIVYRAIIPGNTAGAGVAVAIPVGMAFATGIGIRVTAAVADNDNTSLSANQVMVNVLYK